MLTACTTSTSCARRLRMYSITPAPSSSSPPAPPTAPAMMAVLSLPPSSFLSSESVFLLSLDGIASAGTSPIETLGETSILDTPSTSGSDPSLSRSRYEFLPGGNATNTSVAADTVELRRSRSERRSALDGHDWPAKSRRLDMTITCWSSLETWLKRSCMVCVRWSLRSAGALHASASEMPTVTPTTDTRSWVRPSALESSCFGLVLNDNSAAVAPAPVLAVVDRSMRRRRRPPPPPPDVTVFGLARVVGSV
mmetsp:Transcript_30341/g.46620  ORF Transcript_30341/g.46620 Transcript_30341/m.46620 type:complete len:252 (+) Transcript_30341:137-892(+)